MPTSALAVGENTRRGGQLLVAPNRSAELGRRRHHSNERVMATPPRAGATVTSGAP